MAITRIGIATSTTSTITPPSEAQAGDTAILVVMRSVSGEYTPAGWTAIASRISYSSHRQSVFTRTLTAGDLGVAVPNTGGSMNRMEVWRGVLSVTAHGFSLPTAGARVIPAMPAMPGAVGLWAHFADRYSGWVGGEPPTPPAGVMGGATDGVGTFFGSPITGDEVPEATFTGGGGTTNNFVMIGMVLEPAAPAHNIFRIEASGETGLTPYLLGSAAAQDTEIRWVP